MGQAIKAGGVRGALRTLLFAALFALCLSPVASAQEVTGAIQGTIKDPTGAVVAGATVTAQSEQRSYNATTDEAGNYNFNALQPGVYTVTATGAGFSAVKRENVTVELGRTLQVNFDLAVAGTSENVTVVASEPLVDVTSPRTATSVTREEFEVLPKTLNFSSVLEVAPGTRGESKAGGFQVDGASGSENVFVVDGVEVTRLIGGTLGTSKNIPFDFVREVQVKSAGYEAEYGGATGGVVNVVTRSGGNQFHGEARLEFESDALRASANPTLRLNPLNTNQFEYFSNPSGKDDYRLVNPAFNLGGPIVKNKLWFYSSYAPQFYKTTRRLDLINNTGTAIETVNSRDVTQTTKYDYFLTKFDYAPTERLNAYVSFINSPVKTSGPVTLLPFQTSSTTTFNNDRYPFQGGFTPSWNLATAVNYVVSPKLILSFRGGQTYLNDKGGSYDIPVNTPLVQIINPCLPSTFSNCAAGTTTTGTPLITNNLLTLFDITRRTNLNFDATYTGRLAGQQHTLKGGYQVNLLKNEIESGQSGGIINFYFDQSFLGERGPYGYYRVTEFGTFGSASSRNQGIFLQDSWQVRPNLTLNLGLRFENEYLPSYPIDASSHPTVPAEALESTPQKPISFGWTDKIAPRIGAAWDVRGDGRIKVYGSFSLFYDTMKYNLARGSFGGDRFLRSWYTLDQADFRGITLENRPGTLIDGPVDFRVPSSVTFPGERPTIDPDLKPTRQREYSVGTDYAFSNELVFGARFTRKQLDRTIEDVGGADANGNEVFTIGNPGFGATVDFFDPVTPKAVRNYTGLELRLDKRFSNNWYANVSYIYSRLYGNYSGLASSDEADVTPGQGRTDPNVNRYFDLPELAYDAYGRQVLGRLPTDRPNTFKAFGSYRLNWWGMSTDIGGSQYLYQGTPISTKLEEHVGAGGADIYPEGRGDLGRTPWFTQSDLLINHRIQVGEGRAFKFSFNVLNLFDERNVTDVYPFLTKSGQIVQYEDMADFLNSNGDYRQRIEAQGLSLDPRYGQPRVFQEGRRARFAVGFEF